MKARRAPARGRSARPFAALVIRAFGVLLKVALFVGFIAGLGYGLVTFAATSDHFRVRWIRVEGINVLDEQTILDRCGITQDNNIIFLDARDIRRRVEEIPYVRECRVTCVFPDTVVVGIVEREAAVTVGVGSRLFAVDAEGRVLEELGPDRPHPGPLITGLPGLGDVVPGQTVADPAYREALAVWGAFAESEPAKDLRLSEIAARAEDDIRMYFDDLPYELRLSLIHI